MPRQFPGTNFHDLNLDWLLQQMKNCLAEWSTTKQHFESKEAEWDAKIAYVYNYFQNLDVQTEINNKINAMVEDGSLLALIQETVEDAAAEAADDWLGDHVTQETGYVLDDTLSLVNAAAPAKTVGDDLKLRWPIGRNTTAIASNTDLNSVTDAGGYHILNNSTANTISHIPSKGPGKLIVMGTSSLSNYYQMYYRAGSTEPAPFIRYQTGSWYREELCLPPDPAGGDMTAAIQGMLNSFGYCVLGRGTYSVTGIDMPAGSTILGKGRQTRILLADSVTTGYAVKMNTRCLIADCSIFGATEDITLTYDSDITTIHIGTRHGILWLGDVVGTDSTLNNHFEAQISNVFIHSFTGGGITCENTGYGTNAGITVTNAQIINCGAGINVSYWSEFNRFTNVNANGCYYGAINNGGNNMFVNCGFSSNLVGMFMSGFSGKCVRYDGTTATGRNMGHGSAVGCVINHTNSNTGYAVYIGSIDSGWTFDACQIFYGKIYIKGSAFIMFTNTNFGNNIELYLYLSNSYIFNMCYFRGSSDEPSTGSKAYLWYWDDDTSQYIPVSPSSSSFDANGNLRHAKFINCFDAQGDAKTLKGITVDQSDG